MPIKFIKGNIFNSKCQTLVNTVNCKGFMGKGLALEFQTRYPEMVKEYVALCESGALQVGKLWLYTRQKPWVLNFPTKDHWRMPSKLEYIEAGLKKFCNTYSEKKITSIAFPELGTHNGGLDWVVVKKCMEQHLRDLPIDVEIYSYDSAAADASFDLFVEKMKILKKDDLGKQIGLNEKQATKLFEAFQVNDVFNFSDVKRLGGFGKKTMEKIHVFCRARPASASAADKSTQMEFF